MTPNSSKSVSEPRARGHCLCGAVQYEVLGPLRDVVGCHCEMCRRTSGHYVAATACRPEHLRLIEARGLRWYRSSEIARRGFCQHCGSNLFWEPANKAYVSIMAGTLDQPTGLSMRAHIFADMANDYYRICDGLPQTEGGEHDVSVPSS